MKLSIIIPVYNVELYLRECLDSVFIQDLTGCEVIVVNDGSTDDSPTIIDEYRSLYPSFLRVINKKNGGLSSARNSGLEAARGEYIYFIDSDDYLKPFAIKTILNSIITNNGIDVFYFDCIITSKGDRRAELPEIGIPVMKINSVIPFFFERRLIINPNACSFVYSKIFLNKHSLLYTDGIKYEDVLFKYQLFDITVGSFCAIRLKEPFYVYRIGREGSLSTSLSLCNFKDKQYIRRFADSIWSLNRQKGVAYYHMLFNDAIYMFYEAYHSGYIKNYRSYWSNKDLYIIRNGISNKREASLWILTKISPFWMVKYYTNDLPCIIRRITNVFLTLCTKALT